MAHLLVIAIDPPGKPEGPLDVTDITADSCLLKWKPPKVYRVIYYFQNDLDQHLFSEN